VQSGARNIDHILTRTLLPALSAEFLTRMAEGQPIQAVHVSLDDQGGFRYQLS
jgi:type VI secretion system protein VasG